MDSTPPPKSMAGFTRTCAKCKTQEATLESRSQPVCKACFVKFISGKAIKQIGILGKEIPTSATTTRHYVLGLSRGVSSTVLLHLLNENVEFQLSKGRAAPFELTVVYVDPSSLYGGARDDDNDTLAPFRERFPRFMYRSVPISEVLDLQGIAWTALPPLDLSLPPDQRIWSFFNALPTAASRADILRLFTRHVLLSTAHLLQAQALLLGNSTTALAELTLAETAKGRGFSLPWVINDGAVQYPPHLCSSESSGEEDTSSKLRVYHPLRDALRKELSVYVTLTEPHLTPLVAAEAVPSPDRAVVSHKDLSIEEVMFRYFAEVEESYPSVVANVARTTGKLVRLFGNGEETGEKKRGCGMCGVPLDGEGDERWRGELGIRDGEEGNARGKLCYGCERSTRG